MRSQTLHFVGNFPESAELYGIVSDKASMIMGLSQLETLSDELLQDLPAQDADWTKLLDRTKLGPHRSHYFQLLHPETAWTHVRLSIYPGAYFSPQTGIHPN